MATLADTGRIDDELVQEEIARLQQNWQKDQPEILPDLPELDLFDRSQLASVISVCRSSDSLSEAGRKLFSVSRQLKKQPNDADRLRKYLARFGLSWEIIKGE